MPGLRHGAKRGLFLVLVGFLLAVVGGTVAPFLRASELVPWWLLPLTGVVAAVSMGLTVKVSKYWSYRYLGGFVLGILLPLPFLLQTAFLGLRELALYGGGAAAVLLLRLKVRV